MFQRIVDRAVEIFNSKEYDEETEEAMDAGSAWIEAVHEMIQTDGDAIAVVIDIVGDPHLKEKMYIWRTSGNAEFSGYIKEALTTMTHAFEVLVMGRIENYPDVMERRKVLADERNAA